MSHTDTSTGLSLDWVRIRSIADWTKLDVVACGFHDGVIKELHWSHREYVNLEHKMIYNGGPDVSLLIQLQQRQLPAVEMSCRGVRECVLSVDADLYGSMTIEPGEIVLYLSRDRKCRIVSEECAYRLLGTAGLGAQPILTNRD
jgi:hypothetical protein